MGIVYLTDEEKELIIKCLQDKRIYEQSKDSLTESLLFKDLSCNEIKNKNETIHKIDKIMMKLGYNV